MPMTGIGLPRPRRNGGRQPQVLNLAEVVDHRKCLGLFRARRPELAFCDHE